MKKHVADYWILILAVGLSAFGIIMIQSASFYATMNTISGPYYYAQSQFEKGLLGVAAMIFLWNFNYTYIKRFHVGLISWFICLGLLGAVLLIGSGAHGAQRWLSFGSFSIQPSDIAKLSIVILLADMFSKQLNNIYKIGWLIAAVGFTGIFCGLIMMQPNLSTTICIVLIMFAIMFAAGLRWQWIAFAGIGMFVLVIILIAAAPYRIRRLEAFLNPWLEPLGSGYQLIQSLYAIGSGGFMGVGIGQSMQKLLYIPFAESDFIFAIVAEEIGFVGCVILFAAYCLLIWRGILVAQRSTDPFAILLATGISSMIAIQTIINLCVVTGAIPPTGIPLPFISYGGTSLIVMLASVGILLNLSQYTELPPQRRMLKYKLKKDSIWHNN